MSEPLGYDTTIFSALLRHPRYLAENISFPDEDFSKEITKHFGFSRVTKKTTQLCDAGVQHLITEQTIILENGFYKNNLNLTPPKDQRRPPRHRPQPPPRQRQGSPSPLKSHPSALKPPPPTMKAKFDELNGKA